MSTSVLTFCTTVLLPQLCRYCNLAALRQSCFVSNYIKAKLFSLKSTLRILITTLLLIFCTNIKWEGKHPLCGRNQSALVMGHNERFSMPWTIWDISNADVVIGTSRSLSSDVTSACMAQNACSNTFIIPVKCGPKHQFLYVAPYHPRPQLKSSSLTFFYCIKALCGDSTIWISRVPNSLKGRECLYFTSARSYPNIQKSNGIIKKLKTLASSLLKWNCTWTVTFVKPYKEKEKMQRPYLQFANRDPFY